MKKNPSMSNYRMFYMTILSIIGGLLIVLGITSAVNSIWSSIGVGILACSLVRLSREVKLRKNEDYRNKVDIAQNDERNIEISRKASATTFRFSMLGLCILEILLFAFGNIALGTNLGFIICVMLLIYWISYVIYQKRC